MVRPGGRRDNICDHGLSISNNSWKVDVCEGKKNTGMVLPSIYRLFVVLQSSLEEVFNENESHKKRKRNRTINYSLIQWPRPIPGI